MTDPILAARIYLVDDQAANLRLLERYLGRAGFENLRSFDDPRAALAAIETDQPDLLLLDLHMPEFDGFAVLDALRERLADDDFLPVLVLTGDVEREARARALASGATDFLTKPLDREEVILRTRNLIRTRQLHQIVRQRNAALSGEVAIANQVLEQAAETILITKPDGAIVYANPAFERLSGYQLGEILGENPRFLASGHHDAAFHAKRWQTIAAGTTWRGSMVNRAKEGHTYEVETVVSPIRDAAGQVVNYVELGRDVTRERQLESAIARQARELEAIRSALEQIDPAASPEEIADSACGQVIRLPGVDSAFVADLADDRGQVLGSGGRLAAVLAAGRELPESRARYLWEHASTGPWAEAWRSRPEDGTYGEEVAASGLRAAAYAPLRGPEGVVGVIAFGSHDPANTDRLVEHLPALATFASILGALLRPWLDKRRRVAVERATIQAILDAGAFRPFFQPIVELHTGAVVGYEALSRFGNRIPPDAAFALAVRAGLGIELETATLRGALEAAAILPPEAYLSLNASPALIGSGVLRALLSGRERAMVLEITEHVVIDDYSALRHELATLGPIVRLAVDDAGAGYASLRHILELAPDFVKLDIGLVRGIDADPARQALLAGMGYFAVKRKLRLIAEGIETPAELKALRGLAIGYGQGYLLGRPQDGRGPGPWPSTIALGTGAAVR